MVTSSYLNESIECMDSYRLLEFSGSESENDIIHFTSFESSVPSQLKKKRLKRKERDLLRSSGTLHTESPQRNNKCSFYCSNDLLRNICGGGSNFLNADAWEYFRSIILIVSVIGLSLVTWLALHLQFQLDATQAALAVLEASGSELPAKFHESHVRLQQLEKNHTSLWTSLATITTDLSDVTAKLNKLESSVKALQESLSGSPQLTSLPKDVASIQGSVSIFGSTLQDVQSAVKALKEEQSVIHSRVDTAVSSVTTLTNEVQNIYNATHLPPAAGGREGEKRGDSIAVAFFALKNQVTDLSSSVSSVNASVASKFIGLNLNTSKVQKLESFYNSSLDSLSKRVNEIQVTCSHLERENLPSIITNISTEVSMLKESSDRHYKLLQNITQNVAVVKGVEKKLEGSQLQLASGVSELKQQIQTLERRVNYVTSVPTTSSPSQSEAGRIRTREIHSPNSDSDLRPRRRRWIPSYP